MSEREYLPGGAGVYGATISAPDLPAGSVGEFSLGPGLPASPDRVKAARKFWREIQARDLGSSSGVLYDRATGFVYEPVTFDPLAAADPADTEVELFTVSNSRLLFLRKPAGGPRRIDELADHAAAADAEQARLDGEHEQERARFLERQQKRELTLSDLEARPMPTVRAAARLLLALQGEIRERDGRLLLRLPETLASPSWDAAAQEADLRAKARDAARVLLSCRETVLDALARSGRRLDPARLPDRQAAADGGTVEP